MSLIQCINLGIEFAGTYVLKGINCTIEHNSRIGLIGPNGSGKSTLIKLMLGELRLSEGQVIKARNCRVAYLAQNAVLNPHISLQEYIESARSDIRDLNNRMTALSEQLSVKEDRAVHAELDAVVEKMHVCGAFEHENEIKYVLDSLGFGVQDRAKKIAEFSGGEQTRICLAYLLLAEFDLLIMDEPTNHLDIAMTRWLENYLSSHERPYMVVSHDRVFLDNVCRTIYSLSHSGLSITKGNYSSWYEADQIARKSRERQFERQKKFIAETKDFIRRNMGSQKTSQAKSRLKMLEKLDTVDTPQKARKVHLRMASADRSGNDVFTLKDAKIGIHSGLILAKSINIEAHWQDRIALIGPNGCGKSTLLKILLGQHGLLDGKLKIGASLKTAYYDQHQNALDEDKTVMDTLWSLVPDAPKGYVLSWLARFSFTGEDVDKYVSVLSGGEKSRLYLSVLIHQKPNLLILDEPTNHLDIPMRDALLEALNEFDGSIIFVSHDRHFISSLANKFWVFRKLQETGSVFNTIQEVEGPAEAAIELAFSEPEIIKEAPAPRERKKKINPWHLEQLHKEIETIQMTQKNATLRREHIHGLLADSATYSDAQRVKELMDEDKELERNFESMSREIAELEDKYLELACED
ncbi:MAG: ABC-F family ATP-binding cassette domain-containing protein [Candidatus Cloacimonetes bacterium]|jgi:ATP-binding cassette subfamily F protein 3|nr:ABC-F family ATP-binding cassette domain-containing protein [Candidatus Cloacimonadota bacterium]MDD2507198.1 ABC-F family ATP-binding cassette domain-containing protein [Candidatus Cloacimonadota bacterium]MDD4560608.1 ABC-F family ATP-binding cassette domain-containing protein [Candidatus Cloacimonadota bacterium]